MVVKKLRSNAAEIEFRIEERSWCHLVSNVSGRTEELGADSFRVIVTRLLDFLEGRTAGPGYDIEGSTWTWILTLSEKHYSAYGKGSEGLRTIRIFNERGDLVTELFLTGEEATKWIAELRRWQLKG